MISTYWLRGGSLTDTFLPEGSKILFCEQTILRIKISGWNFDTMLVIESARVCFFYICILNPTMDAEKGIPMKHTKKMKYLLNITIFTCFMSSFSRQTDINKFLGGPNRLDHPQGLREQHPGGLQQDSTSTWTLTYYICFRLSFSRQTDIN